MDIAESSMRPPFVTDINPYDQHLDPFEHYGDLRALGPVVWLESLAVWAVFRDSLVRELITDHSRFTATGGSGLFNQLKQKGWRPRGILEVDPPEHGKFRSIMLRVLSPAAINKLKDGFIAEAQEVVERALEQGEADAVTELARPFPLKVFLDAVGVADTDRENVVAYNEIVRISRFTKQSEWTPEFWKESERLAQWVSDFTSRENVVPGSVGSQIYAAADSGEVTEAEAKELLWNFIAAGTETTMFAISNSLYHLAMNPDQWKVLVEDRTKTRAAFDEGLRIDAPAPAIGRCAVEEMEWEGVRIGKHDKIMAFLASANRDPERWAEPNRYLITRDNLSSHLGLGTGTHGCVGQMMSRLEGDVLLSVLASKVESIELTGEPVRAKSAFRGYASLPMRLKRSKV